jgi:hypothetical protein
MKTPQAGFKRVFNLVGVKGEDKTKCQAEIVSELIAEVEKKLKGKDVKVTLADYIRLVQLRKELDEEQPREIRVTWETEESGDES